MKPHNQHQSTSSCGSHMTKWQNMFNQSRLLVVKKLSHEVDIDRKIARVSKIALPPLSTFLTKCTLQRLQCLVEPTQTAPSNSWSTLRVHSVRRAGRNFSPCEVTENREVSGFFLLQWWNKMNPNVYANLQTAPTASDSSLWGDLLPVLWGRWSPSRLSSGEGRTHPGHREALSELGWAVLEIQEKPSQCSRNWRALEPATGVQDYRQVWSPRTSGIGEWERGWAGGRCSLLDTGFVC